MLVLGMGMGIERAVLEGEEWTVTATEECVKR